MIRRCGTPGCGTFTLGDTCLACEQERTPAEHLFPRGRPYVPVVHAPVTPHGAAITTAPRPSP